MTQFNQYARRLDTIATEAFDTYQLAQTRLQAAEAMAKQYPKREYPMPADYEVKRTAAEAALAEARKAAEAAKDGLTKGTAQIAALRKELAAEIDKAYSADPGQLDTATLELLKSGILRSGEYAKLLKAAQDANNTTMQRIIGKYAADAAEAESATGGQYTDTVKELRQVFHASRQTTGAEHLERFDYMADVYNRAVNTPVLAGLTDRWSKLTAEVIENF